MIYFSFVSVLDSREVTSRVVTTERIVMSESITGEISHGEEEEDYLEDSNTNIEEENEIEEEPDTNEKERGCITHHHLDEMILKLETLERNVTSEMEEIINSVEVVATECRGELETALSTVSLTEDRSQER